MLFFIDKSMVLGLETARMFAVLTTKQHEDNTTECPEYDYHGLIAIVIMPYTAMLYV